MLPAGGGGTSLGAWLDRRRDGKSGIPQRRHGGPVEPGRRYSRGSVDSRSWPRWPGAARSSGDSLNRKEFTAR